MKKLIIICSLLLSGCYADFSTVGNYPSGEVEICDEFGECHWINAPYYYDSTGALFYWDVHFGCWIGPHGYYRDGVYYRGFYPGYHYYYRYHHWYHLENHPHAGHRR